MHPARIFLTVMLLIGGFAFFSWLMTQALAPEETMPRTVDLARPRAPAEARRIKNPVPMSDAAIAMGRAIYHGKGTCVVCHGQMGRGDGPAGAMTRPAPRDFTDTSFQAMRADGELFWTLQNGIPGTGMIAFVPRMISEEEAWQVIHYIRSFRSAATD